MTSSDTDILILLVEDHDATARLMARILDDVTDSISTQIVSNGRDALAVLQASNEGSAMPDLMLLDLDMPVVDGYTVLERRQEDTEMRRVPTIVFSNSDDRDTIRRCYEVGANAFVMKPDAIDGYDTVARRITEFWCGTATLPPSNR